MSKESLFSLFVNDAAEHLANRLAAGMPEPQAQAFRAAATHVLRERAASVFGGERVYAPRTSGENRDERRGRIAAALERREPLPEIARREGVSLRLVQKIRRLRTTRP